MSQIRKPAEAEKFKLEKLAEAERLKIVLEAEANAEALALKGEAEAFAIGKAMKYYCTVRVPSSCRVPG